jgi:hypothetical protein
MKKKTILSTLALAIFFIGYNQLTSNPLGAPAGYSGSPADGQTCANCHGGSAVEVNNVLTSDVPTTGYVPGTNYTITVAITGASTRKGFQVSPQNSSGVLMGTLTAGSGNKVVNSKYVTHTAPTTTNPGTWTFTWTAPAAGTGTVNFYGAFVSNKNNITKQVLTVNEQTSTGVETQLTENETFNTYPNPATGNMFLNLNLSAGSYITASLINLEGKQISTLYNGNLSAGKHHLQLDVNQIKTGVYFLQVTANGVTKHKKIMIQ